MTSITVFACLCAYALVCAALPDFKYYASEDAPRYFEDFMRIHGRQYADEQEKSNRFEIFKQRLEVINEQNRQSNHAEFGITQFADWTADEFKHFNGLKLKNDGFFECDKPSITESFLNTPTPAAFDWRENNAVTRVKNQCHCGSCWAFSAIGALEGQYAIKNKKLLELSEQQLLDCDKVDGACDGGLMSNAYHYLKDAGGSESEDNYPYKAVMDICDFDKKKVETPVQGCTNYTNYSEDELKLLLTNLGPLAIGIDGVTLLDYKKGIITDCKNDYANHGVLLVGYGEEKGIPFWIVKNSWSALWGEEGYFRVKRGENQCGLTQYHVVVPKL